MAEFGRAVELDPQFALAWAELADSNAQLVYYWTDASEERIQLARSGAERALAVGEAAFEALLSRLRPD